MPYATALHSFWGCFKWEVTEEKKAAVIDIFQWFGFNGSLMEFGDFLSENNVKKIRIVDCVQRILWAVREVLTIAASV